jgi:hypothetical protein
MEAASPRRICGAPIRQLHDDVESRENRSTETERLSQHSLHSVSIHRALQLTLADDEAQARSGFAVHGRIQTEATGPELDGSCRQHGVELPFLGQAVLAWEAIDRSVLITPTNAFGLSLCGH